MILVLEIMILKRGSTPASFFSYQRYLLLVYEMAKTIMIYLYNWIIRIPYTQIITTLCQVLHQKNLTGLRVNTIIII
jgi:hypothetical protein